MYSYRPDFCGLHNYVVRALASIQDLGNRIANDFLVPVGPPRVARD